jgi:IclR family KDG regulon transcriptional repressor
MNRQAKRIGSVQRAINILNLFDRRTPELGTTDIARALDLPKSTVAGIIFTLAENGYLDQNSETRKYRLGFKLAERANIFLSQFDLREIAYPYLQSLRNEFNESTNLAILDGRDVVYIERLLGFNMLGMNSEIGKREKAHSTALGKAIIAYMPEEEIYRFVEQCNFEAVTPHTIVDPKDFILELKATRARGFAIDDEENELGGRCVAAPVFDYRRVPVGAISISVPLQRFPKSRTPDFGKKVKLATSKVSQKLGFVTEVEDQVADSLG